MLRGAVVAVQAAFRRTLVRRDARKMVAAATVIQRQCRCWLERKRQLQQEQQRERAVLTLQQYWRGAVRTLRSREHFIYLRRAAVILQAAWRARRDRRLVARTRAAITLQRHYRGAVVRRHLAASKLVQDTRDAAVLQQKQTCAASTIQRWWRLQSVLRRGRSHPDAVVRLQRCWRRYMLQKLQQVRRHS